MRESGSGSGSVVAGGVVLGAIVFALGVVAPLAGQEYRTLAWEAELGAPVSEVWEALTTEAGVTSWMVPVAEIDFRVGGHIRTHYEGSARIGDPGTITHHIIAYEPERLMVTTLTPPEGFPFNEITEESWGVWSLEPLGPARTRFRLASVNLKRTERFDEYRAFFDRGNRWTLDQLRKHLEGDGGVSSADADAVAEGRATSASDLSGSATLADFAWLEGVWIGGGPEDGPATAVNETHYMAPAAGVMPAMMRLWDGEKLMVLEFFDIVGGESGLEMRLRHFDASLRAWETDGPLVLHLVEYDGHRSVWATAEDAELQIRSDIVPGTGRYHTRTVITRPDGSEQVIENVMKRK